jgi:uncharacterized protein (TIGR03437 family)
MPRCLACVVCGILLGAAAPAQPVVNAIENNYSYIPPGLPNYGIAQGSIFVIFGINLATVSSSLQSVPLKTVLNGVSVQFTVGGATTQALLYYVLPNQVAGILPSATPVGTGTVTVTSGSQSSAPAPVTVVESAVGIVTIFGNGSGPAAALDANSNLLPFGAYSANPGDVISLYGTGLGPVSGDESVQQTPQNLSGIPLEVDIGGVPATVTYHGRSIFPGLDQINVVVPEGPLGCSVSVVARTGAIVSNVPVIPVAAGSRVCSDDTPGVVTLSVTVTGNAVSIATLSLAATEKIQNSGSGSLIESSLSLTDSGSGAFSQIPQMPAGDSLQISSGPGPYPSFGSCVVNPSITPMPIAPESSSGPTAQFLDAGPVLNFTGPNGEASLPFQPLPVGGYGGPLSLSTGLAFIPGNGGTFTIDNGAGGKDVGPFSMQINFPPLLIWSNASSGPIDRSQPLTLQWSGGNPAGFVQIYGFSSVPGVTQTVSANFQCAAPVSARQFTVPASVLLALPAQSIPAGSTGGPGLTLASATGFLFTAPGLDSGIVFASSNTQLTVAFQ